MRSLFLVNVALASVSLILTVAILACSADALNTFNSQQSTNEWLLPIWRDHFDVRDLQLIVATSVVITILNVAFIVATVLPRVVSAAIPTTLTALSASVALVAVIFPAVIHNTKSPYVDTLRTWTCGWDSADLSSNGGPPSSFSTICTESRFAFYTTIPVFIIQLCLVTSSVYAPVTSNRRNRRYGQGVEKGQSLDPYQRQTSSATSQASPKSHAMENVHAVHA